MAASERHRPQHAARCTRGPQCRPQDCFGVPGLKAGKIPLAPWVDRSFPSRGQNISHSKTNNGSRSNTRSKPRVPNSSKANSWKCKLCDKVFKTPSALRSHMISSTKKHQTKNPTKRVITPSKERDKRKKRDTNKKVIFKGSRTAAPDSARSFSMRTRSQTARARQLDSYDKIKYHATYEEGRCVYCHGPSIESWGHECPGWSD